MSVEGWIQFGIGFLIANLLKLRAWKRLVRREGSTLRLLLGIASAIAVTWLSVWLATATWSDYSLRHTAVVAIAPFEGSSRERSHFVDWAIGVAKDSLRRYSDILVRELDRPVRESDSEGATLRLARRHRADVLIWGWYEVRDTSITVVTHVRSTSSKWPLEIPPTRWAMHWSRAEYDAREPQAHLGRGAAALAELMTATARYGRRDFVGAAVRYERALRVLLLAKDSTSSAVGYFLAGTAVSVLGEHTRALALLDSACAIDPTLSAAQVNRGRALEELGREEDALEAYAVAIAHGQRERMSSAYLARASLMARRGDLDGAHRDIRRAREVLPGFGGATYLAAVIAGQRGDTTAAESLLDKAIQELPTFSPALTLRARLHGRRKNHFAAIADYSRAIDGDWTTTGRVGFHQVLIDPLSPLGDDALFALRSEHFAVVGDTIAAIRDLTLAIQVRPDVVYLLNRSSRYLGCGRLHDALKDCDRMIQMNPRFLPAYVNRAATLRGLGKAEEAVKDSLMFEGAGGLGALVRQIDSVQQFHSLEGIRGVRDSATDVP